MVWALPRLMGRGLAAARQLAARNRSPEDRIDARDAVDCSAGDRRATVLYRLPAATRGICQRLPLRQLRSLRPSGRLSQLRCRAGMLARWVLPRASDLLGNAVWLLPGQQPAHARLPSLLQPLPTGVRLPPPVRLPVALHAIPAAGLLSVSRRQAAEGGSAYPSPGGGRCAARTVADRARFAVTVSQGLVHILQLADSPARQGGVGRVDATVRANAA